MRAVFAFLSGGLFGAGLLVSGMVDTTKVQGWLDIFGDWDPTLAFVLGGAVIPMFVVWQLVERRLSRPALGGLFPPKPQVRLDRNLILGSVLFGAGWALAGLCPGPAMASITYGGTGGLVFLGAMVAGMLVAVPVRARLDALPRPA